MPKQLTEPSTYASIAALAGSLAASTTGSTAWALGAVAAICGAIGVFLKEHPAP